MAAPLVKRLPYPTVLPGGERDASTIATAINSAVEGNLNVIGQVTLLAGTTETTLHDPRISGQSFFCWQALDPAGATVVPSIWYKTRGVREAVFGHADPGGDVVLEFAVFG